MSDVPDRSLVAFDMDCTLTVRDTFLPFVAKLAGRTAAGRALLGRPVTAVSAAGRRDRDQLKALVVARALGHRSVADVELVADRFARTVCSGWLRPDTVRRLRWHQWRGDCTVIVTASLGVYAGRIGDILGVDGVVATAVEDDGAGSYTGRLLGANCRGEAKVAGLRQWASAHGLHGAPLTHAYGDSSGDVQLLAAAERAFRVDRRGWQGAAG